MVDLTGYTLLDGFGLEREPITGSFSQDGLAQLFIEHWVPYYECHKCSRVDYCKFPIPVEPGSPRMLDIQCGVVVAGVRNFVHATYPSLSSLSPDQLQGYLDGAYHLSRFLFDTEVRIGSAMDRDYIDYLEDTSPSFFGRFVHLREHLNGMAASLSTIPELHAERGILLVEGQSEKAFIERLKLSHLMWFLKLEVDTYKGSSRRRPSHLEMLAKRLADQGYRVYIQGDADGTGVDIFDALVQKGFVAPEDTFGFEHDFESAVPLPLAFSALRNLGYLQDQTDEELTEIAHSSHERLNEILHEQFNVNLDDIKVEFAEAVADIINWGEGWSWFKDEEFMQSELGQFLLFIRGIF